MTDAERIKITELRRKGMGYGEIASQLNMSRDTVSKFCQRRRMGGHCEAVKKNYEENKDSVCLACGLSLPPMNGRGRKRKFCSDRCRAAWWKVNSVLHKPGEKTQTRQCSCCGAAFKSFASAERKYCSHKCYIEQRFGGKNNDRTN